ncbi:hypothetical protein EVA_15969 [gut metagenome]|uniref:Uncharacterized protein n=1 Tax=gut metagenome TaxID=749906 RepID=J9G8X9_9ZZZZ
MLALRNLHRLRLVLVYWPLHSYWIQLVLQLTQVLITCLQSS